MKMSPKKVLQAFGQNLRSARVAAGLSQQAFAAKMKISVSYVSLLERGQRNPGIVLIVAIARVLKVPPASLAAL